MSFCLSFVLISFHMFKPIMPFFFSKYCVQSITMCALSIGTVSTSEVTSALSFCCWVHGIISSIFHQIQFCSHGG